MVAAEDQDDVGVFIRDHVERLEDGIRRPLEPLAPPSLGGHRLDVLIEHRGQVPARTRWLFSESPGVPREDLDLVKARVDEVRQHKVDQAVSATDRHSGLGAILGQWPEPAPRHRPRPEPARAVPAPMGRNFGGAETGESPPRKSSWRLAICGRPPVPTRATRNLPQERGGRTAGDLSPSPGRAERYRRMRKYATAASTTIKEIAKAATGKLDVLATGGFVPPSLEATQGLEDRRGRDGFTEEWLRPPAGKLVFDPNPSHAYR